MFKMPSTLLGWAALVIVVYLVFTQPAQVGTWINEGFHAVVTMITSALPAH